MTETAQIETEELWLPVVGYEGLYEVSNRGYVRSLGRTGIRKNGSRLHTQGRQLKLSRAGRRLMVWLCDGRGAQIYRPVYQLVMEAFVGPCPPGMEVLHWDDNPTNNHLTNLRYGTRSENVHDAVRNGRHACAAKTHCKHGHPFSGGNVAYDDRGYRTCRTCARIKTRRYRARKAVQR